MLNVGLISDTHGLLRPEAVRLLTPSDLILHAGDVGREDVLDRLGEIAPVRAVRGNTDGGPYAERLPDVLTLPLEEINLLLHHGHLPLAPERLAESRVVVQGHSHRPLIAEREGLLLVNPGSAGPKRFRLPVTVARLRIHGFRVSARLLDLS